MIETYPAVTAILDFRLVKKAQINKFNPIPGVIYH